MITFKTILKKTLPVIEKNAILKDKYLNIVLDDMIRYDTLLKEYFNPEKVYKEFYSRFKFLPILPDSLKFIKIFYYSSQNIPLKECVEKLTDEIDVMNGYFEENLINDIKEIRNNISIATFVLMNFGIDEIKKALEKNKILENVVNKIIKWNIEDDFKKVIKWVDNYKNSMGIDEYNELVDSLEAFFGYYDVDYDDVKNNKKIQIDFDDAPF